MKSRETKRSLTARKGGPIAEFDGWFSSAKVSRTITEADRQELKQGLIYETFRRHPEVLWAKRQEYLKTLATFHYSDYRPTPWLHNPWNAVAFEVWEKPWIKLGKRNGELIALAEPDNIGPPGVSMSVSELLPEGEQDVCKYIFPKPPLTMTADSSERPVERVLLESNAEELERLGWKLFAIDCHSKEAVKKAASWICDNHVSKTHRHGTKRLESWTGPLLKWNERFAPSGNPRVQITEPALAAMGTAWKEFGFNGIARPIVP